VNLMDVGESNECRLYTRLRLDYRLKTVGSYIGIARYLCGR